MADINQAFSQVGIKRMKHAGKKERSVKERFHKRNRCLTWLTQLWVYLEGNIDFLELFLLEKMPEVKFFQPRDAYLGWFDFRSIEPDPKRLEDLMRKKANVLLDEGYVFGKGGEGFERINFACPRSTLDEVMNRIHRVIGNR